MKAVVLQPTYLPWMGYFAMMDLADVFIYYDDVQFSKQSWQQRNRIRSATNDAIWLTVPIKKGFGQTIQEAQIDDSGPWRKKHWKTIEVVYCKAPFFKSFSDPIRAIYEREWTSLAEMNICIIEVLAKLLEINVPKTLQSSTIRGLKGAKEERLLNLLNVIGADDYISGPSAKDYIQPQAFLQMKINLHWFEFEHPEYPQFQGDFIPFLSVVDLLFNLGEKSIEYIREGAKNAIRS